MQCQKQVSALTVLVIAMNAAYADEVTTLDEVVVTASRAHENKREVSSNVTIINSEEIKASTAATVADLIVQQGFQVTTAGDESNVLIRGFGNRTMNTEAENTVLTLLNGRRIGNANLAIVGLSNVERIEIIRGPAAVQYGSSAMGGVINVITRQGTGKASLSVEAGLGSDNLKREKLAFSGASNGFDFALGLTNFSRDDLTTQGGRRWHHTEIDRSTTANLDLGYRLNQNHRVGINYNYGGIKSSLLSGSSGGGIRPYSGNTPNASYSSYFKHNRNTALSYTGSTEDRVFDWSSTYAFGRDDKDYKSSGYVNTVKNRFFNVQGGYNGALVSLSGGLDTLKYENSSDNQTVKTAMKDTGVYLTGKLRLLENRVIASAGGRYDQYTNKGTEMSSEKDHHFGGSVGVAYLAANWLKLRTNYAEGFKMPAPRQVGGSAPYYNPNPALLPEKSKTYEFGADVNWNHVSGSLTYFHSDWENKIIGLAITGLPMAYQFQNIKDSTLAGVEGSVSADLGKIFQQNFSLSPYLNFTWLETRKNKDKTQFITYRGRVKDTLPNTPEWMLSYGVNYAHPGYGLKSRINANYYGSPLTRDWSQGSAPYIRSPSGTVVNLSLEKDLAALSDRFGKLTLRTEINNLFDSANEMYWGYPGAGRNFYVGLRYDY
ncbi:MAG: TonB-dependent receptor [Zoogloeaceae bacterium]|jgi:vitamin B12 transporter|nr:TonB-dependent receptor [Zoogloeaceae bacterium]